MLGVPPTLQDGDTVIASGGRLQTTSERGAGLRLFLGSFLSLVGITGPRTLNVQDRNGTIGLRDAGTVDGIFDWSNAISVTGSVTATAGRLHVCTGTTADYTVTLPSIASSIGQSMAFVMGSALTRLVTLDANAAELIDGSLTRIMWANEVAIIYNNGTQWVKVSGKTMPMSLAMKRTGGAISVAATTWTAVTMDTVVADNTSALAVPFGDTTNWRAKILRPGVYACAAFTAIGGAATNIVIAGGVVKNAVTPADNPNAWNAQYTTSAGIGYGSGSGTFNCVAGDWVGATCYNGDAVARNMLTGTPNNPTLNVTELPSW